MSIATAQSFDAVLDMDPDVFATYVDVLDQQQAERG